MTLIKLVFGGQPYPVWGAINYAAGPRAQSLGAYDGLNQQCQRRRRRFRPHLRGNINARCHHRAVNRREGPITYRRFTRLLVVVECHGAHLLGQEGGPEDG